jgi:tRNA A37 threonylcarbamoyladenosine dehydratase
MPTDISWLSRTELLIGNEALRHLTRAHVMVVGLGGVGSYAAEFIARSGVGKMTIIDGDVIEPSNRNRQLIALANNTGEAKTMVMAERLKAINPELEVSVIKDFINPEMVTNLLQEKPDYIIDAIDSVQPKITFMRLGYESGLPMISSMGSGGRLDPSRIKVADLSETYNCPFAQQIRKMLKAFQVRKGLQVVFSSEKVNKESLMMTDGNNFKKSAYGTISYMPAAFGVVAASVVIRNLIEKR